MLKTSQLQLFFILGLLALLMSIACDDTDRLVKAGWNKPTNINPTYVMTSDLDVVYGDVEIYKNLDSPKPKRKWVSRKFHPLLLELGWMPAHTSMFIKSVLYSKIGKFDTSFLISGDYDFILRLFKNKELKSHYMPSTIIKMLHGGASTKNFRSFLLKSMEDLKALKINKIKFPFLILLVKKISKITQFKILK